MATTDDQLVTAEGLANTLASVAGGGRPMTATVWGP